MSTLRKNDRASNNISFSSDDGDRDKFLLEETAKNYKNLKKSEQDNLRETIANVQKQLIFESMFLDQGNPYI